MLHLTDEQKLNKLKEVGNIIEIDKINNNGFVSDKIKTFTIGALFIISVQSFILTVVYAKFLLLGLFSNVFHTVITMQCIFY